MAASTKSRLDEFLEKLENILIQGTKSLPASFRNIPAWAVNSTDILYTDKSVPDELNEPGKLYVSFKIDQPNVIQLRGQTKDNKPINRYLHIEQKASNVTISSKHIDFLKDKHYTCSGTGRNLNIALDQYFSNFDLKRSGYQYSTKENVKDQGDAFLFAKTLASMKSSESIAHEIVGLVREMFQYIPEENHPAVLRLIEKAVEQYKDLIHQEPMKKMSQHYDGRLWTIMETVCTHFDPLQQEEDQKRKGQREVFIAQCCRKHMKGENVAPQLHNYFEAMKMHREVLTSANKVDASEALKQTVEKYRSENLCPEKMEHHEKIKHYHHQCQEHQANQAPSEKPAFKP